MVQNLSKRANYHLSTDLCSGKEQKIVKISFTDKQRSSSSARIVESKFYKIFTFRVQKWKILQPLLQTFQIIFNKQIHRKIINKITAKTMIRRISKSFPSRLINAPITQSILQSNRNIKNWIKDQYEKNSNQLRRQYREFDANYPNGKYGLLAILVTTYVMYEMKREEGEQKSVEQLIQSLIKSQTDTIQIIKYINTMKSSDKSPAQQQGNLNVYHFKVHYKINGVKYYVLIADPELLLHRIKSEEEFKTYKTRIIQKQVIYIDIMIKRFFNSLNKIILPLMLPILLYNSSMGKMFQNKFLGHTADGSRPNVLFKDIAGLGNAKIEVSQLVDFLKNPQKYKAIGAKIPKGALLSGPPGTGKTMLAKACAGQAQVPFFSVSGSEFVQLYAGMGATRVRDLFKNAKKQTPAIIFIDQIDAIGRKREDKFGGANDQRANTLNQLLVQMDGFGTSDDIIVLAATNRKQMLDNALTRPGRFDRMVQIQLPDIKGRRQILEIYLNKIKLSPTQSLAEYSKRISTLTFGFSGADLANLCNQAAILAVRKQKKYVQATDFQSASDRVLAGLQQSFTLDEKEKRKVAYHQCGHAVASWFLEGASPLLKITIVPRSKGSLGFAQYLPNQSSLMTKQMLCDQLCVALGGRTAQQVFFGEVTNGAADDLNKVRQIARSIVISYGMNTKYPNYAPVQTDGHNIYSQETAQQIDNEVHRLIIECTQKTRVLLKTHKDKMQKLAQAVLKKQSLNHKEITQILGERPFQMRQNYKQFLQTAVQQSKFSWLK